MAKNIIWGICQLQDSGCNLQYVFLCPCGAFYIGKTHRCWWKRICDHITAMNSGDIHGPLGRDIIHVHKYTFPPVKFLAFDRIHQNRSGGNWNKNILECKAKWIYEQTTIIIRMLAHTFRDRYSCCTALLMLYFHMHIHRTIVVLAITPLSFTQQCSLRFSVLIK